MKSFFSASLAALLCTRAIASRNGSGSSNPSQLDARDIEGFSYVGCYTTHENGKPNALSFAADGPGTHSVDGCQAACKNGGWTYAGLEAGYECQCGHQISKDSFKVDDSQCDKPCRGDSTQICGGKKRMSIYGRERPRRSEGMQAQLKYEGCFFSGDLNVFNDHIHDDHMSVEKCCNHCKKGLWKYAALFSSKDCYCDNGLFSKRPKAPDSKCDSKCPESDKNCGGQEHVSLFDLGSWIVLDEHDQGHDGSSHPHGLSGWIFGGCYQNEPDYNMLALDVSEDFRKGPMTVEHCCSICEDRQYRLSGVMGGKDCHCGHELENNPKILPASHCAKPCPDNDSKGMLCADSGKFSIWTSDPKGLVHVKGKNEKGKERPGMQCSCKEKTRGTFAKLIMGDEP